MNTIRKSLLAGLAIAVAALGTFATAAAEPLTAAQSAAIANGLPKPRCSRPVEEEAARVNQLVALVAEYRTLMETKPLQWVTFKYYEAELAATRRCLQSASAGQAVVR